MWNKVVIVILLGALGAVGLSKVEFRHGEDFKMDTDGDGLTDAFEVKIGTDPRSADTDKDGLEDWLEVNPKQMFPPEHYPSPKQMDIYVEVQYMLAGDHDHAVPQEAKEEIIKIFAEAPVENPDGSHGIRLHLIDGGAIAHSDPISDEVNTLTTRGVITGWDNLYSKWYENSPRSRFSHYVIIAHYLDEEEVFLASHSPGNSFAVAGARLKTNEDWVVAFTLGLARNAGVDVGELQSLDFSDPEFWTRFADGIGVSLKKSSLED